MTRETALWRPCMTDGYNSQNIDNNRTPDLHIQELCFTYSVTLFGANINIPTLSSGLKKKKKRNLKMVSSRMHLKYFLHSAPNKTVEE